MDNPQIIELSDKAIDCALNNNWQQSITYYKKILTVEKNHLDAILGLAFACLQTNNIKELKKYYKKALTINPTNTIALNNIDRIKTIEKKGIKHLSINNHVVLDPNLFINLSGKTKVIALTHIGQVDTIAKLKVGERVNLKVKRRRLEVRNHNSEYIGALPDDISKRLIYFL